MSEKDGENTILLMSLEDATVKLDELGDLVRTIRQKVERSVWKERATNPHLGRPIGDMGLSLGASRHIPVGATTVGELCEHTMAELPVMDRKYLREIRRSLASMGLTLRPLS